MRALITGSGGLIGSECTRLLCEEGWDVIGLDNDMRSQFFGSGGTTKPIVEELLMTHHSYRHLDLDIRNRQGVRDVMKSERPNFIIHTAAQPSHDKAAYIPYDDFDVNATGTMNLLVAARDYCPESPFCFTSTNKVYGDRPNTLPLIEHEKRFDYDDNIDGIDETMSIDACLHSLFGASKVAADVMCQEFARYFKMPVGIFRAGCLTGPQHSAVELHGYLAYIVLCAVEGKEYKVIGYKGKQVRDQIHCRDVANLFLEFHKNPTYGEVYNLGGGRNNSLSILETIDILKQIGYELSYQYEPVHRIGDHVCYISDLRKIKQQFPNWKLEYDLQRIIIDIVDRRLALLKAQPISSAGTNLNARKHNVVPMPEDRSAKHEDVPTTETDLGQQADSPTREDWGLGALDLIRKARRIQQECIAECRNEWIVSNRYYYDRLKRLLRFIVEPGKRVLEVRCGTGHLLKSVEPSYGVGVDISTAMVNKACDENPGLHFIQSDPETLEINEKFDYILFSHIFDTSDILSALRRVRKSCSTETRLIVINYNYLWQPALELASKLGLRSRFVEPNWLSEADLRGFLELSGFRPIRTHRLILFPKWIPFVSNFLNDVLGRLPGIRRLCMMEVMVARPLPEPKNENAVSVSVVVPCRNEKGNVQAAVERLPEMGKHTEIIFCDDHSTDGTTEEVRRMQELYPQRAIRLVTGPGICKSENVWTGFRAADGDVVMILDGDLAVMPEELPEFFRAIVAGHGEFINGSRLVYPMRQGAMKFFNILGNIVFSWLFSFLLDQRIKDTLCGTKVIWRKDWPRFERLLGTWGMKDLWGDYELLFGATRLHLEIVELPVHYQERIYGISKMTKVFANGMRMLRICWHAWMRIM